MQLINAGIIFFFWEGRGLLYFQKQINKLGTVLVQQYL